MQLSMTKKNLLDGLSILERVIPARSSNPTLTAVKVRVVGGTVTAEGTNLEIDARTMMVGASDSDGELTVPMHLFHQVVRNAGADIVNLTTQEDGTLRISSGGGKFDLQTGDNAVFPELTFQETATVQVNASALASALKRVRHAASQEAFQAVFRGILMEFSAEGGVRCVASDGYRVAVVDVNAPGAVSGITEKRSVIVPARSAEELIRLLTSEPDGTLVGIGFGEGLLTVRGQRGMMGVKLLDGDFPDYRRVIPTEIKVTASVDSERLLRAVNNVAILADKNANNRVDLKITRTSVRLEATGDYGAASEAVDGTFTLDGGAEIFEVAFNAKHLVDALGQVNGPATLRFKGSQDPATVENQDKSFMGVLVALRV